MLPIMITFTTLIACSAGTGGPATTNLRVEYSISPINIQNPSPVVSWVRQHDRRGAVQTKYQVVVTTAAVPATPVWDSGVVLSNTSLSVHIQTVLKSDTDYAWSVVWWDERGVQSPRASTTFSTSLLDAESISWAGSAWVGGLEQNDTRNQLRASFAFPLATKRILRARCFVATPGYHTSSMNGVSLNGDAKLGPATLFTKRVHYDVYDCASSLVGGGVANVFATTLGRGWWQMPLDNHTQKLGYLPFGERMVRVLVTAMLEETGTGKVTPFRWGSGEGAGWTHHDGPIVTDHLFLGEVFDARLTTEGWRTRDFDDSKWSPLSSLEFPKFYWNLTAKLVSLTIPPITRRTSFTPVDITKSAAGWVFDLGVNMAGSCTLTINDASGVATAGDKVYLRHAEAVDESGELLQKWLLGGAVEQSTYIISANSSTVSETWTPSFSYFGFRFVELIGYPNAMDAPPPRSALECHAMHTSLEQGSTFRAVGNAGSNSTAASTINAIQQLILNSARANYFSHPTDCPTREKRGWTGDGGHAAETLIMNFGMAAPYRKWLDDISDSVQNDGGIPNISPMLFGGHAILHNRSSGGDPAWGAGFINTLDWNYLHHGDVKLVERHYPAARAYITFLSKWVSDGLLQLSYPRCTFGDWCAPSGSPDTPAGAKHTSNILEGFFWIIQLERMARFATVLGHTADAVGYLQRASLARTSFLANYYDEELGFFRDQTMLPNATLYGTQVVQTEQALALTLRVGSKVQRARAAQYLADIVRNGSTFSSPNRPGHLNVGMVGVKYLLPALADNGFGDVALRTMTTTTYPSFGFFLSTGATTLYERFEAKTDGDLGSLNHIMLGSPGQWLYQGLAGISLNTRNSDPHAPAGWSAFDIFPKIASAISAEKDGIIGADATHDSVLGPISVSWRLPALGPICGIKNEVAGQQMPPLVFKCEALGAVVTNITFASFGTPTGTCATGLAIDPACDAKTSVAVVTALCLGKSECAVYANVSTFGDPCHQTKKSLAVQLVCGEAGGGSVAAPLALQATVPFGANASVVFPVGTTVVAEGGVKVFSDGAFQRGVEGVRAAMVSERGVEVIVGGGQYAFRSS